MRKVLAAITLAAALAGGAGCASGNDAPVCRQAAEDNPTPADCAAIFAANPGKRFDYHDGGWWMEGTPGYHPGR